MTPRRRRGAIIGFGFIAEKGHLPAYARSDELEIVAVADLCAARRDVAAHAIPGARIYESYAGLLRDAGDLDFVDVSTPPYVHAEIARAALQKGLHVLCEKPLATTVEDARVIIDEALRQGRVLFPVENYRHAPVIVAVRQLLATGLIGAVHDVTLSTFRNTHARGVKEWNAGWRRETRYAGGGVAMDHGSHTFYLAFEWLRSYPTSITAKMRTPPGYDTEDTFVGTATFPTGMASVHLTWTAGIRKVIYTLHGERGAIRVEDDDIEVAVIGEPHPNGAPGRTAWEMKTKKVASEWMDAGHAAWFRSMFRNFATAMDEREHVGRPAMDALRCIELLTAAYQSASDGSRERRILPMG
ncbi:MAG: oxidoreductase [Labilithrix sp.]|jgi:predicted dehydrogenase|nr:oxidoreductase [Labilithrix sp.]